MRQRTAVCLLLLREQEEITFSRCSSSTLQIIIIKVCHLHYSELHTFRSCLIDQVSLWTVKKLRIMDLQFFALQFTRTRNSRRQVHSFILRTQQSQWQEQTHYCNTGSFPLETGLHTVRSESVLNSILGQNTANLKYINFKRYVLISSFG